MITNNLTTAQWCMIKTFFTQTKKAHALNRHNTTWSSFMWMMTLGTDAKWQWSRQLIISTEKIQYIHMQNTTKYSIASWDTTKSVTWLNKKSLVRTLINLSINLKWHLSAYGYLIFTFPVVTFSTKLSCPCAQISDIYNNIFRNI